MAFILFLTAGTLDQDLGHVEDAAQGLDVLALPAADGLRQDLQLQLLSLPHLLTLRLGAQGARQGDGLPAELPAELLALLLRPWLLLQTDQLVNNSLTS